MGPHRQFHCWSSLRSIFGMMVPCCGCESRSSISITSNPGPVLSSNVTGTIFGQRKGRVNFCIQNDPTSSPLLLLEFGIPTYVLVKEMQSGILRITLECEKKDANEDQVHPMFSEPVWSMSCNGRKVGFALKKGIPRLDSGVASVTANVMSLIQSVSIGAGVIPTQDGKNEDEELIYMRATYERVIGSPDCEAFHMINPDGTPGQELSIFLTRL